MSSVVLDYLGQWTTTQYLVTAVIVLLILFYYYSTSYLGVWEKVGVPGPKPLPLLNHMLDLRQGLEAAYQKWFQQYGQTFGCYGIHPHKATLVTKDLNLIKEILVKDFENFTVRYRSIETKTNLGKGLSSASAGTWQRHRHVTNPMFTGVRMKAMLHHVTASARNLTELIRQCVERGDLISIKQISTKFSTEVIARVGFGIYTHPASTEETEFAHYSRTLLNFGNFKMRKSAVTFLYYFPHVYSFLQSFISSLDFINSKSDQYFNTIVKAAIDARKRELIDENNARDMLDLLTKASVEDNDIKLTQKGAKKMTEEEIMANSKILILAGVETIATALQGIMFCLAQHPEVQVKVVREVDEVITDLDNIEYEQLSQLKYTEQVINEGLRLFPLLSYVTRLTKETKKYGDITIVKGTVVQIPLGPLMVDPDHWTDPYKFDPDRFTPENKAKRDPMAYLPFGYGPRICLGQRLAMMELKIVLAYLLKNFQFGLSERSEPKKGETIKMELFGSTVLRPQKPVLIEAIKKDVL
ncbi:cytochrome P450 3A2 [Biomphalaria glabrata]|uniref:Cytochrome P450 3A2-like n=1 Tax=Biomphalaria glabrata TaxID=6526 RepID=A0A9U8ELS2_BIOGL|nr:cytochrome P450 3A2-like [Biomphalaria glabrata]KAI8757396.1 cytochrome P450 3A2-like [Biomphalaria glabrata]